MENRVNGPTAVFQTTTRPDVDPETRSRFLVTTIDESRAQTARILESQRKAHTLAGFRRKLNRADVLKRHHAFQRLLRPLPVFNPFADLLTFNDERLLMRRDQPKYLALIDTGRLPAPDAKAGEATRRRPFGGLRAGGAACGLH